MEFSVVSMAGYLGALLFLAGSALFALAAFEFELSDGHSDDVTKRMLSSLMFMFVVEEGRLSPAGLGRWFAGRRILAFSVVILAAVAVAQMSAGAT